MANSKRKCPYCGEFNRVDEGYLDKSRNRVFCNEGHAKEYRTKGSLKTQERRALKFLESKRSKEKSELHFYAKSWMHHFSLTYEVMQRYARLRDLHYNRPCITCGKHHLKTYMRTGSKPTGGHYKGKKAHPEFALNLWNIHMEHNFCNSFDGDHIVQMEPNIRDRIGVKKFGYLNSHVPMNPNWRDKKYLARMRKIFKKRMKRYEQ